MAKRKHIHELWHGLTDYLKTWYFMMGPRFSYKKGKGMFSTKRKYKCFEGTHVLKGHKALDRMYRFVKNNPDVICVRVDDSYHASSDLFLIPHETDKEYWGTTVVFVPQCGLLENNHFFLYPHHLQGLIRELTKLDKRYRKKGWRKIP